MSNRKVIQFLLRLESAKDHGKNYIKVKPHLVRHLLRERLFAERLLGHSILSINLFPSRAKLVHDGRFFSF